MQTAEPRPQVGWLQAGDRFGKRLWFEIEKERHGQTLQVVNAFRGFHRRAGQDTRAPGLMRGGVRQKLVRTPPACRRR